MDLQTTKLNVLQKVMSVDKPALLEKINELLDEELIVGYTTEGKPLTNKAYNERLRVAEGQVRYGNYTTQENLEEESEDW